MLLCQSENIFQITEVTNVHLAITPSPQSTSPLQMEPGTAVPTSDDREVLDSMSSTDRVRGMHAVAVQHMRMKIRFRSKRSGCVPA